MTISILLAASLEFNAPQFQPFYGGAHLSFEIIQLSLASKIEVACDLRSSTHSSLRPRAKPSARLHPLSMQAHRVHCFNDVKAIQLPKAPCDARKAVACGTNALLQKSAFRSHKSNKQKMPMFQKQIQRSLGN